MGDIMNNLDEIKKNETQFDNVYRYKNKLVFIVKRNGEDIVIAADTFPELKKRLAKNGFELNQREHNIVIPQDTSHEGYFSQVYTVYDSDTGESAEFYGPDMSERAKQLRRKLNR